MLAQTPVPVLRAVSREGWDDCQRCPLSAHRRRVVHYRGDDSPHFVFLGEAPGRDEDKSGFPFVGRSGALAETLLDEAATKVFGPTWSRRLRYGFANVVGCIPYQNPAKKITSPVRPPLPPESAACRPRLDLILHALGEAGERPHGAVLLGKTAAGHRKHVAGLFGSVLELQHPAYLLRQGGRMSVAGARFVQTLQDWLKTEF